jgi:hypothetical protein
MHAAAPPMLERMSDQSCRSLLAPTTFVLNGADLASHAQLLRVPTPGRRLPGRPT